MSAALLELLDRKIYLIESEIILSRKSTLTSLVLTVTRSVILFLQKIGKVLERTATIYETSRKDITGACLYVS